MQETWRSKRLCRTSALWIDIRDTHRRIVLFRSEGHLQGRIYNMNGEKHETFGRPAVWRSDRKSIDVAIRPRLLGHIDGDYHYEVNSSASRCHCPQGIRCTSTFDRVPDEGYITVPVGVVPVSGLHVARLIQEKRHCCTNNASDTRS